jgi:chromosome segregation ATPase
MNLTEITTQIQEELTLLESRQKTLLQTNASLEASSQLLKSEAMSQQKSLSILAQKSDQLKGKIQTQEALLQKNQETQEALSQRLQKTENEATLHLKAKEREFDESLAARVADLERRESEASDRLAALTVKEGEIESEQERISTLLVEVEYDRNMLERDVADYSQANVTESKRLASLASSLSTLQDRTVKESELLAERKSDFAKREQELRRKEESIAFSKQSTEESQKKALELADTYERRIKIVDEREKGLRLREIRLADREGVALSHG